MQVEEYFSKRKGEVEARLGEILKAERADSKITYALSRGKRLRPSLTLLVFEACEGRDYESVLEAASAGELMHSASLVLDDVLDRDLLRRGKPAAYIKYGAGDAALLSQRMVSLGFKIVMSHGLDVVETFIETWDRTLKGERIDIELSKGELDESIAKSKKLYLDVITKKSASSFAGACKIGAQEAEAPKELQNLFWNYGTQVGIAYQLADDYIDMRKGQLEVLPLMFLLEAGTPKDERKRTVERFVQERNGDELRTALKQLGVNSEMLFKSEMERAISETHALIKDKNIPNPSFKRLLVEVPKYVVTRTLAEAGEHWDFRIQAEEITLLEKHK